MYPLIYFFWPQISGLLTLLGLLASMFFACTSMPLLVDELNK